VAGDNGKTSLGQPGFTVAELLVGCAIFGVLAAISVPQFVAFQPQMRLNGASREVFGQLMKARAKAVEENNNYVVSIPGSQSLSILDDNNNNGTADVGETSSTVSIQINYPDVTITKATGHPDPVFLPRGTAQGSTTLTLTNSAGSRTVTVNLTGVVKIS
jgi:type IV fimbrial biogenesis protein FimT